LSFFNGGVVELLILIMHLFLPLFSAARLRYLRHQTSVTHSMHSLFRQVSDRLVAHAITESNSTARSARHADQFLHLLQLIQRWFCYRHLF